MDSSAKGQLIERLKTAHSVLVTVSRNPSVDQLAACIALTLIVNKLGGHGSAVFSGQIPSTIEFLKPEETLEKTADSLRDFIIALDKSKADKLRYKVEDEVVRIFITPYRTSLSEGDLEFSQGDFNVELIVALGVKQQEDLDQAIVAHGRILHDATIACINTTEQGNLGSINWQDATASSLCELIADLVEGLDAKLLDEQIATCLLTGVIAETDRFSNEKTTSQTMSVSGKLMSAGANQKLVASNLTPQQTTPSNPNPEEPQPPQPDAPTDTPPPPVNDDGTLNIDHKDEEETTPNNGDSAFSNNAAPNDNPLPIPTDNPVENNQQGTTENPVNDLGPPPEILPSPVIKNVKAVYPNEVESAATPPSDVSDFTAPQPSSTPPSDLTPPSPPSIPPAPEAPEPTQPSPPSFTPPPAPDFTPPPTPPSYTPPPQDWTPPPPPPPPEPSKEEPAPAVDNVSPDETLSQIEEDVDSPHQRQSSIDEAREKVEALVVDSGPDQSIGASPLGEPLHEDDKPPENLIQPQGSVGNTGLDPSLFSEVPTGKDIPPVPPPLPFNLDKPATSDNPTTSL